MDASTHDLLVQLKNGCDEAMYSLYPRYEKVFYSHAINELGALPDIGGSKLFRTAEDIVQTVFTRIAERIDSYDEARGSKTNGEPWLWTICRNIVEDFRRRYKPVASLDERLASGDTELVGSPLASNAVDPIQVTEDAERARERGWALTCAWERLPQLDRDEIRRGRGRGPGRKEWHRTMEALRSLFFPCYEGVQLGICTVLR
jgi:DNA-directed RNA polymerase specialized sigma24 family protein